MLGFINKKATNIKIEAENRRNEELKINTIEETDDLPTSKFTLPAEGTLISTSDPNDIQYLDLKSLIDPDTNLYYYNSCICEYKDGYRLFYRCGKNPKTCEDKIATCLLTNKLQVIPNTNRYVNVFSNWQASRDAGPDTLDRHIRYFYSDTNTVKSFIYKDGTHVEDPRVVQFQGYWFLFYTDGLTVGVAKLDLDTCDVIYSHFLDVPPANIISKGSDGREKNWIPIVSNNELYLLYSDTPRTFIHCKDMGTKFFVEKYEKLNYIVLWKYGSIRGGCPPIYYDKTSLIWFFHSSKEIHYSMPTPNNKIYYIGAYISSNVYPFEIKQITKFPILFGPPSPLRSGVSYQTNVVFPCGAVADGTNFLVSMGINDYCIGHLKVFRNDIVWEPFEKTLTYLKLTTFS